LAVLPDGENALVIAAMIGYQIVFRQEIII